MNKYSKADSRIEEIIQKILEETKILDVNARKDGVEKMIRFLFSPDSVNKMIAASKQGLPAFSFLLSDVEALFDEKSEFPIVIHRRIDVKRNKQIAGLIAKKVMECFGYTPDKTAVHIPEVFINRPSNINNPDKKPEVESFHSSAVYSVKAKVRKKQVFNLKNGKIVLAKCGSGMSEMKVH